MIVCRNDQGRASDGRYEETQLGTADSHSRTGGRVKICGSHHRPGGGQQGDSAVYKRRRTIRAAAERRLAPAQPNL